MTITANIPPLASELRDMLGNRFFGNPMEDYDLTPLAELAIGTHGEAVVFEYIKSVFDPFQPSSNHKLLQHFVGRYSHNKLRSISG